MKVKFVRALVRRFGHEQESNPISTPEQDIFWQFRLQRLQEPKTFNWGKYTKEINIYDHSFSVNWTLGGKSQIFSIKSYRVS